MAESTPSILARLKSVGIDPKFIMFCPICNDDAPDPVAAKA